MIYRKTDDLYLVITDEPWSEDPTRQRCFFVSKGRKTVHEVGCDKELVLQHSLPAKADDCPVLREKVLDTIGRSVVR